MANTYRWEFSAFDCYPQHAGQTDVVFTVHYSRFATSEEGHTANIYGTIGVKYAEGDPFVPFEELTPETVIAWVESAFGDDRLAEQKATLDQAIQNQITPPVITRQAPWVQNARIDL